jgi:protein TonB
VNHPAADDLRPYLTYSMVLHLAAAGAIFLLYRAVAVKSTPVYMIDFVGPSAVILSNQAPAGAAARAAAPAPRPQSETEEFSTARRRKGAPLPRPSLLRGWRQTAEEPAPAEQPQAAAAAPEATAAPGTPGQAGIATDMPNFPYPWYISQIRQILWAQWSGRMPKEQGSCVAVFTLLPNGSFVDLRIEESSGDSAFDLVAMSAVQDGAPYPPLPHGFKEPFLKIHVTLKTL